MSTGRRRRAPTSDASRMCVRVRRSPCSPPTNSPARSAVVALPSMPASRSASVAPAMASTSLRVIVRSACGWRSPLRLEVAHLGAELRAQRRGVVGLDRADRRSGPRAGRPRSPRCPCRAACSSPTPVTTTRRTHCPPTGTIAQLARAGDELAVDPDLGRVSIASARRATPRASTVITIWSPGRTQCRKPTALGAAQPPAPPVAARAARSRELAQAAEDQHARQHVEAREVACRRSSSVFGTLRIAVAASPGSTLGRCRSSVVQCAAGSSRSHRLRRRAQPLVPPKAKRVDEHGVARSPRAPSLGT